MSDTVASHGSRVKFLKHGNLMVSHKIFHNGDKMVRLIIDPDAMVYKLVDPVTGHVYESGGEGITNMEVLQRKAKKALKTYLGIKFDKETRNVK